MGERPAPVPGVDLLFTDEDATEILDFIADEVLSCPGCGLPKVESHALENTWAYRAVISQCHACAAKARAGKQLDDLAGVYAGVEKRT